jgi:hypothetical protein
LKSKFATLKLNSASIKLQKTHQRGFSGQSAVALLLLMLVETTNAPRRNHSEVESSAEFMADSITRDMTEANSLDRLNFVTSDCRTVDQEQDQDQGKEEPKDENTNGACLSLKMRSLKDEVLLCP